MEVEVVKEGREERLRRGVGRNEGGRGGGGRREGGEE